MPTSVQGLADKWLSSKALLILSWLALSLFVVLKYDYAAIAEYGPCSWHGWRQSDGLAIAINYYEGSPFWEPKTNSLIPPERHAVAEFPALYYLDAMLWKIFGYHYSVTRIFHFLLLLLGMLACSFALLRVYKNAMLAAIPPFVILGAAHVAFYSFNFLPNTVAIGLVLASVGAYVEYVWRRKLLWFYLAMFFSLMAGMLKITTLVTFFAWFASFVLLWWPFRKKENLKLFFPAAKHVLLGFVGVLAGNILWILWAKHYNEIHQSSLFLMHILPVWEMTEEEIRKTLWFIWEHLESRFYRYDMLYLLLAMLGFVILNFKKFPLFVNLFLWFSLIGNLSYTILFLQQLKVHDYYFIDVMTLPILVMAMFFYVLHTYSYRWFYQLALVPLAFICVNINFNLIKEHLDDSYRIENGKMMGLNLSYFKKDELWQFQKDLGLEADEPVLSLPDPSPNQSLIYLQRKGITSFIFNEYELGELYFARKRGIRYIIISKIEHPYVKGMLSAGTTPKAVFDESIYFYDLEEVISDLEDVRDGKAEKS